MLTLDVGRDSVLPVLRPEDEMVKAPDIFELCRLQYTSGKESVQLAMALGRSQVEAEEGVDFPIHAFLAMGLVRFLIQCSMADSC